MKTAQSWRSFCQLTWYLSRCQVDTLQNGTCSWPLPSFLFHSVLPALRWVLVCSSLPRLSSMAVVWKDFHRKAGLWGGAMCSAFLSLIWSLLYLFFSSSSLPLSVSLSLPLPPSASRHSSAHAHTLTHTYAWVSTNSLEPPSLRLSC